MTLFWRSFLLIAALLVVSVLASFQILRLAEREPRARELAQQAVSVVNLTRAALINADPYRRRELLIDLNEREGIRVYPVTNEDRLVPLRPDGRLERVAGHVRAQLGDATRFAVARDGMRGFWVSFLIDEDEFWVMLPRERFEPELGLGWLGWGALLLALALLGASLIAASLSRPLRALAGAALRVGSGQTPAPLDESGPRELVTVSAAFNRMARDLEALERERAMVLAGISHDVRTPLSRLRLALEMSGADPAAAQGMHADIEEMDQVVGQFLEFARGESEARSAQALGPLLAEIGEHYAKLGKNVVVTPAQVPPFPIARLALRRAIGNLIDNALRYAGEPVEVQARRDGAQIVVEVLDRGPGIPENEAERLKRPFTRLDEARGGRGGAGLGLAIVDRVARAHGGRLELAQRPGGGLAARLVLGTAA
ncbi:MAG: ATP-binding protein [Betaproteobacteria bacterium]|nr:ATP-binding protein [Betaproteobacteria bacterium]MDH5220794.1 ATP-binding protein [Betaproteobacteria bacterium]MDH5350370.1 ATP-binding protein [Betaproteobacteria bacterium]